MHGRVRKCFPGYQAVLGQDCNESQRFLSLKIIGTVGLSKEEIEKLSVMCSLSQTGNYRVSYALSASNTLFSSSRVIDSGVIDYMTHSQQFITYNSRLGNL